MTGVKMPQRAGGVLLGALAVGVAAVTTAQTPDRIDFSFEVSEGLSFAARIDLPSFRKKTGYAVLLLGGARGSDLDWFNPPEWAIDGRPSRDAVRLAAELTGRGYVVLRWNEVPREDHDSDFPYVWKTAPELPVALERARRALAEFRARKVVADDKIILLGYSLGGWRAAQILETDPGIAGVVLLAGAQLVRTGDPWDELETRASELLKQVDANSDEQCSRAEVERWLADKDNAAKLPGTFQRLDRDGNGAVVLAEILTQLVFQRRAADTASGPARDRHGKSWGEDILMSRRVPMLAIYGSLDPLIVNGYVLRERAAATGCADFELNIFPDFGHGLGVQKDNRAAQPHPIYGEIPTLYAPFDARVLHDIGTWLDRHFPG